MELIVNEDNQTYKFKPTRIQSSDDASQIDVYFSKFLVLPDETEVLVSNLTNKVAILVDTPEKQQAVNLIQSNALEKLQQDLEQGEISTPNHPRYSDFYNALTTSNVFQFASQQVAENLPANAAYTDFSNALLALCIGTGSSQALQSATNNLIAALTLPADSPLLAEAQSLIDQFHIPIALNPQP